MTDLPIPPNCRYFDARPCEAGPYFISPSIPPTWGVLKIPIRKVDSEYPGWRPIIAAAAEVAWLRKAESLKGCYGDNQYEERRNARASRAWGEEEDDA